MSFEELRDCFNDESGLEGFCELAVWLTMIAVRSKYIREDDDIVESDTSRITCDPVQDIKLSAGPLLSSKMKDSETISYSCWHLVNETSWPEIAKLLVKSCPIADCYAELLEALETLDPKDFSLNIKILILSFLRDEACSCDKVRKILNDKLREVERIQERKRAEDGALRKKKELLRSMQREAFSSSPRPVLATGGNSEGEPASTEQLNAGQKFKLLTALDLMKALYEQDAQPFEFKHQGQKWQCIVDTSGPIAKVKYEGEVCFP
jgi:hypothetical protein